MCWQHSHTVQSCERTRSAIDILRISQTNTNPNTHTHTNTHSRNKLSTDYTYCASKSFDISSYCFFVVFYFSNWIAFSFVDFSQFSWTIEKFYILWWPFVCLCAWLIDQIKLAANYDCRKPSKRGMQDRRSLSSSQIKLKQIKNWFNTECVE